MCIWVGREKLEDVVIVLMGVHRQNVCRSLDLGLNLSVDERKSKKRVQLATRFTKPAKWNKWMRRSDCSQHLIMGKPDKLSMQSTKRFDRNEFNTTYKAENSPRTPERQKLWCPWFEWKYKGETTWGSRKSKATLLRPSYTQQNKTKWQTPLMAWNWTDCKLRTSAESAKFSLFADGFKEVWFCDTFRGERGGSRYENQSTDNERVRRGGGEEEGRKSTRPISSIQAIQLRQLRRLSCWGTRDRLIVLPWLNGSGLAWSRATD